MTKSQIDFRVRCYEQDFKGRIRPGAIFNWFQDAAGKQCLKHGVALEQIIPRGYTWVIHRYRVVIHNAPVYTQKCRVITWAYPKRDLISIRDYAIESETGERLVSGTSEWVLLDMKTLRPLPLSTILADFPVCTESAAESGRTIKLPPGLAPCKKTEFDTPVWALDGNRHINNSAYVIFAYENMFPDVTAGHQLREIEVNYKKQGFYGQQLASKAFKISDTQYLHSVELADTGEPLALLKTVWENDG
ncbi:MAG: thioesterase [Elusimicrobiaceae bacterium]|nr:thioesterase [Elusimicrobiaceae bacterium]